MSCRRRWPQVSVNDTVCGSDGLCSPSVRRGTMEHPQTPARYGARRELGTASPSIIHTVTRVRAGKPAQIDVPSFSTFQAQGSMTGTASPVRRKPLPTSASPSTQVPRLSSGGRLVAVGEDLEEQSRLVKPKTPKITPNRPPWLPQSTSSPTLVPRDLDQ